VFTDPLQDVEWKNGVERASPRRGDGLVSAKTRAQAVPILRAREGGIPQGNPKLAVQLPSNDAASSLIEASTPREFLARGYYLSSAAAPSRPAASSGRRSQ